ncbi:2OG-Fe(II) oxygenase [Pigmentiphaga litoralis]|nr:2OG-Fe(II) oxygenase [Pigmentiphaga litoralis]
MGQASLFDDDALGAPTPPLPGPPGFRYEAGFLSPDEEADLLGQMAGLPFEAMRYKSYVAQRRVVSYGGRFDFDRNQLQDTDAPAPWVLPLRNRIAAWVGLPADAFTQILVAEYSVGTPLGWHRDVPDFEDVVGVSLAAEATMRFRPYRRDGQPMPRADGVKPVVLKQTLAPRSIYLLRGPARWDWQHSVSPTRSLRYSITFRTSARRAFAKR